MTEYYQRAGLGCGRHRPAFDRPMTATMQRRLARRPARLSLGRPAKLFGEFRLSQWSMRLVAHCVNYIIHGRPLFILVCVTYENQRH